MANKKKVIFFVLLLSLSLAVAYAVVPYFSSDNLVKEEKTGFDIGLGSNVEKGGLEVRNSKEIQKALNETVEKSMINISMNMSPTFYDGNSEGNLSIINEDTNNYMQVIQIYKKDNNQLIYTSGGIPVGSKIKTDKLDVNLSKGTYECIAYFNAVDDETGELIGKAGAEINITMQN